MAAEAPEVGRLDVGHERLVGVVVHPAEPVAGQVEPDVVALHEDLVDSQLGDLRLVLGVVHAGLGGAAGLGLADQLVAAGQDLGLQHLGRGLGVAAVGPQAQCDGGEGPEVLRHVEQAHEVVGLAQLPAGGRQGLHRAVGVQELRHLLPLPVVHRDGVEAGAGPAGVGLDQDLEVARVVDLRAGLHLLGGRRGLGQDGAREQDAQEEQAPLHDCPMGGLLAI